MADYQQILNGRNYTFKADVDAFVKETTLRMQALALQATQDLIEEVQTPVGKGGKMRVDTGFLRASGQFSLTGMPSGPDTNIKKQTGIEPPPIGLVELAEFELGRTIYFGWTAHYAKYREAFDGFLISGVQNWQTIVNRVCEQIKQRSPANRG